jgi:hypothetical protein
MTPPIPSALLFAAVLSAAAPGAAQPRPDPLNAAAPVPALKFSSSLAGYRPLGDDTSVPWKEANDTTARIGGWRSYAREARAPAPAASASAPPPSDAAKK